MTIPRTTAKKLSTEVEYRLISESFLPQVKELSEKGLSQRIKRARAARNKYRDLAERQIREARGLITPHAAHASKGNKNTVIKQKLFEETLARYEKQAAQMNGAGSKASTGTPGKRKAGAASSKSTTRTASVAQSAQKSVSARKAAPGAKKTVQTKKVAKTQAKAGKTATSGKTVQPAKAAKPATAGTKTAKAATKQATAPAQRVSSRTASRSEADQQAGAKEAAGKRSAAANKAGSSKGVAAKGKNAVAAGGASVAKSGKKKAASRTSASRAGTLTKPVKIPPLKQVLAAVSDAVAARKEGEYSAVPPPPQRSPKAPAITNEGAPPGSHYSSASAAAAENPEASEPSITPPGPAHRGRAAPKPQQARRAGR